MTTVGADGSNEQVRWAALPKYLQPPGTESNKPG